MLPAKEHAGIGIARIGISRVETAAAMSCCVRKVDQLIAEGSLPCYRIGKSVRVRVIDIEKFVAARITGGE